MPLLVYTSSTNVPLLLFRNQWTLAFSILDALESSFKAGAPLDGVSRGGSELSMLG